MCVCMYACMGLRQCVHACECAQTCACVCCTCVCMHEGRVCAGMCAHRPMRVCTCGLCLSVQVCVRTGPCVHMCACMRAVRVQVCVRVCVYTLRAAPA